MASLSVLHGTGSILFPVFIRCSARNVLTACTKISCTRSYSNRVPMDDQYYPSPAVLKAVADATPFTDSCSAIVATLHDCLGGPFWTSILVITLSARALITTPLAVLQRKVFIRLTRHRPEFDSIALQIAQQTRALSKSRQWTEEETRAIFRLNQSRYRRELYIKYNCHPARAFMLPLVQVPLWIVMSLGLRGLCVRAQDPTAPVVTGWWADSSAKWASVPEDLRHGGFGWIQDFTLSDPYFILPLTYTLAFFLLTEISFATFSLQMQALEPPPKRMKMQRTLMQAFRFSPLVMLPVACIAPAALSFYWLLSMVYGLLQNLLLLSPRLLNALDIVPLASASAGKKLSTHGDVMPKSINDDFRKRPYKVLYRRIVYRE